jgi:violaxanthin de-epoxidase
MGVDRRGVVAGLATTFFGGLTKALAMTPEETAGVGTCLITKAPFALARCIVDPTCLANLACIQTCTGKPDEGECQVKCGDEFSNDVVGAFTKAAVSDTKCVPQRPDDNSYPVPQPSALVQSFDTAMLDGDWYITAGLNPSFDIFDCQFHKFSIPGPGKLKGDLQWRIKDPLAGTQFVTRATVQEFVQDEKEPGILYNHDNEFLHYQDDWYILAAKPREYVLIYYRGNNDAWDGYGGAVVYTPTPTLDPKYYDELDVALQKIGKRWADFKLTDNSCKARESRLEEFENDIIFVESKAATGIQLLEKVVEDEAVAIEREFVKDINIVDKEIIKDAVAVERELEKDATAIEKELEKDVKKLVR